MKIDSPKITVVAKDIGGADILIKYLIYKEITNCNYYLSGKARNLFKNKLNYKSNSKLVEIYKTSKKFILSTGISDFEKKIMYQCQQKKIFTTVIMDHWINYKNRFIYNKKLIIPNEIIVFDILSRNLIKKIFSNKVKITLIKDLHLTDVKKQFELLQTKMTSSNENILILSEPILEVSSNKYKYNQYEGIDKCIRYLNKKKINYKSLIIRPHPKEKIKNYYQFKSFKNIKIENKSNLINEIYNAKLIFGFNSIAFFYACFLKKKNCYLIYKTNSYSSNYPIKKIKTI